MIFTVFFLSFINFIIYFLNSEKLKLLPMEIRLIIFKHFFQCWKRVKFGSWTGECFKILCKDLVYRDVRTVFHFYAVCHYFKDYTRNYSLKLLTLYNWYILFYFLWLYGIFFLFLTTFQYASLSLSTNSKELPFNLLYTYNC